MRAASWNTAAAPRSVWITTLWASLLGVWQLAGAPAASAEEALQPAPESVVVVDPAKTTSEPRLLYALDGGQMSMSELRPGTMDSTQLTVYLSMLGSGIDRQAAMADPTQVLVAAIVQSSGGETMDSGAPIQTAAAIAYTSEIMPRSYMDPHGVWVFPRQPGSDEREILGFDPWRVEESVESQILFLGPDRQFGLDDFMDLVNPLQHIPLVNIAYRAVTGDEIYGAARLLDVGFGPAAGVSTVASLAFESTTGESMEDQAIAAVFGPSESESLAQAADPESAQLAENPWTRRGSNQ